MKRFELQLEGFGHGRKEIDVLEGSGDGNNGGTLDKTVEFCDHAAPNDLVYGIILHKAK